MLALAVAAGVLVGGGIGAGIILLDDSGEGQAGGPAPGSAATVPAESEGVASSGEASSSGQEGLHPSQSRAQMASEAQALLLEYHEDVLRGDLQAAWGLLSSRKRQQDLREDGYAKWAKSQATLASYLIPAGLSVRVDDLEGEGVARVLLTGMRWTDPDASCSEWSGLTWVKFEGGRWTYDPGYSTTPERERAWKPRYDELLGAAC